MKRIKKLKQAMLRFYQDQDTIERKMFWAIVPLTCLVGIGSVVGTLSEKLGLFAVLSGCACTVIPMLLAVSCYRHHNDCQKYYKIFCICINCVLMPMTFLTNGGLHSGMPMYCFGVFLLCSFCTTRHDRHLTSSISFASYILWFLLSVKFPGLVIPIRENFIESDIILSYAVGAISMMILISRAMNQISTQRYEEVNNGLIDSLGSIIEFRSLETGNHVHNIKQFTAILLETANRIIPDADFSREDINMIASASVLHDIGKVAVPDVVLQKPGRLTKDEFEIIKNHPVDGCAMIATMQDYQNPRYYAYCYEICRHHHERYDGTGYPDHLKGDEIPLISQIVSIADVYEALTSKRVYKDAYTAEEATDIILHQSPGMFSEKIIECFLAAKPKLDKILARNPSNG